MRRLLESSAVRGHLLLALLGALIWSRSIHPGVVDYDTPWMVVDNPVLALGGLSALREVLWGTDFGTRMALGAEYLPVRDLSVLLDLALWPTNYRLHHAHNLVLFLVACGLLLELMVALLGRSGRAWLAAAFFCCHPIQAESVVWLVGRKECLSGLFVFGGLLAWVRWGGRARGVTIAALCMLLGCWSKSTAVVFPALALAISVVHLGQRLDRSLCLRLAPQGVLAVVIVATATSLGQEMGFLAERRGEGLVGIAAVQGQVLLHYAASLLWPPSLSALYSEPSVGASLGFSGVLGLAALAAAIVAPVVALRRCPVVGLGMLWFAITLAPTSQIVGLQNLQADRYLFLPLAGLSLVLGALLPPAWERWSSRSTVLLLASGVLLLVLGFSTWQRISVWRDSVSLWTDVVEKQPTLSRGHGALAGALAADGRPDEATRVLDDALKTLPDDPRLLEVRGALRMQQADPAGAEVDLRAACSVDPQRRKAANNLALLLHRSDRTEEGLTVVARLVSAHPNYVRGLTTQGTLLFDLGRFAEAVAVFSRAASLNPFDPLPVCNLGSAAYRTGDSARARAAWQRCLELRPGDPVAIEGLAVVGSGP